MKAQKILAAWQAANEILAEHGQPGISREEVVQHVEQGRDLARRVLERRDRDSVLDLGRRAFRNAGAVDMARATDAFEAYIMARADARTAGEAFALMSRAHAPLLANPDFAVSWTS